MSDAALSMPPLPTSAAEAAAIALFALLQNNMTGVVTFSRRLVMWNQVPAEQQPAVYLVEHNENRYYEAPGRPAKRELHYLIFVYARADDPGITGGTIINNLLSQIDAAIAGPPSTLTQTLGDTVYRVWIEGVVIKDPGDLDKQVLLRVPVKCLLP